MPKSVKLEENINTLKSKYSQIDTKIIKTFADLPISIETKKALKEEGFDSPTEIQRESIGLALQGLDILGAAKTGSGKTLAFLIPILEKLYSSRWTRSDGPGALVITPTRELAYQIFETLRRVGRHHEFSAGLVIGGKDLKFEWKRVADCNILICTPGRLLQHLDQNPVFNMDNLQMLVLDEADRCLDLGFSEAVNAIVSSLPPSRQTLLFSATQTRNVQDLARLSLDKPVLVSVHENSSSSTPDSLTQSFIVTELGNKINILWSFLRAHRRKKTIVFMASCKQTKYYHEIFSRLKPGMSVMALYGSLHQLRRMAIYDQFCEKDCAVLFATDIAARGLDFPSVDWVVQLDCPEDVTTYTHRVGRTARYNSSGESLLILSLSEEEGMVRQMASNKIPISKIEINPAKQWTIDRKMAAFLAGDKNLKESAQRAFNSYVKSVYLMKNKAVFDVDSIDLTSFAESLGLPSAPRVRFLEKQKKLKAKQKEGKQQADSIKSKDSKVAAALEPDAESTTNFHIDENDSDEDVFTVKRKDHSIDNEEEESLLDSTEAESTINKNGKVLTKAQIAKKLMKKKIQANTKKTFDEAGDMVDEVTKQKLSEAGKKYEEEADQSGIDISKAKQVLMAEDKFDKSTERARIREKHKEEKRKRKEENRRLGKAARGENEEGDEESEEEGSEPDLSWLPDPDKIYGNSKTNEESEGSEDGGDGDDSESNDEEVEIKEGKRKLTVIKKVIPKKKLKQDSSDDEVNMMDTGLSLIEDEDLALKLLS